MTNMRAAKVQTVSRLDDHCDLLVLDASVVINLNATGMAERILDAAPFKCSVPKQVKRELDWGAANGHDDARGLERLVSAGLIVVVALSDVEEDVFLELVAGATAQSLGDGEAATLALASSRSAHALIDERKARRIAATRFPAVKCASTVDLLVYKSVQRVLGEQTVREALYAALKNARMRVLPEHADWVCSMIGAEWRSDCPSLSKFL